MQRVNEIAVKRKKPADNARAPVEEQHRADGSDDRKRRQKQRGLPLGRFAPGRHGQQEQQRQHDPVRHYRGTREAHGHDAGRPFRQSHLGYANEENEAGEITDRHAPAIVYVAELTPVFQQGIQIVGMVENDFEQRGKRKNKHNGSRQGEIAPPLREECPQLTLTLPAPQDIPDRAPADHPYENELGKVGMNQKHSRKGEIPQVACLSGQHGSRAYREKQKREHHHVRHPVGGQQRRAAAKQHDQHHQQRQRHRQLRMPPEHAQGDREQHSVENHGD